MAGRKETTQYSIHPSTDNIRVPLVWKSLGLDIINNEKAAISIFAQTISALHGYSAELKHADQHVQPYVLFTEPNGKGFHVGRIIGWWNSDYSVYEVDHIMIYSTHDTDDPGILDEITKLRTIGYSLIASESFISAAKHVSSLQQLFHR